MVGVNEIFSVPSAGGTPIKLNGQLVAGGNVSFDRLQFSPDSSRVLYLADQDTAGVNEIFSVPSAGGTPVKLNGPLVAGGSVSFSGFSPDGSRVLYLADQETDDVLEFYLVPSTGGTPVKLNGPLVAGGSVSFLRFSPDGSRVLYVADQETDDVNELYVRIVRDRANPGGGDWDTAGTWDQSVLPDEVMQTFIDTPATVTVTGNVSTRTVNELIIGGGTGSSTLDLQLDATITAINGVSIQSGGVLRGTGHVIADVTMVDGGEIRVGNGNQLQIGGAIFANAGRIEAIGTGFAPAEIEFDGAVTNDGTTGEIFARNALLRFDGGLTNDGSFSMSFGTSDIFGDVTNSATGTVIVSGNSNATFYDDVVNDGELRTSAGTAAVFFGDVSGSGTYTGSGSLFFEGLFSPGNSPAAVSIETDVAFGPGSTLEIELGGLIAGDEFDQLHIGGTAMLDGTLLVDLIGGFLPSVGDAFEILTYGVLDGAFEEVLFAGALDGVVDYGPSSLTLTITAVPEPTSALLLSIVLSLGALVKFHRIEGIRP